MLKTHGEPVEESFVAVEAERPGGSAQGRWFYSKEHKCWMLAQLDDSLPTFHTTIRWLMWAACWEVRLRLTSKGKSGWEREIVYSVRANELQEALTLGTRKAWALQIAVPAPEVVGEVAGEG